MSCTLKHHCITTIETPNLHIISCLAVNNNFLYVASVNEIDVYDLSRNTYIEKFNDDDKASGSVKSIAFNTTKIITAHQDNKIRVWQIVSSKDSKRHRLISTLPTIKDRLRHFMLPKNYVSVRRHKKRLWVEHCDAVSDIVVNYKLGLMYSVSWDKSLKIWNAKTFACLESVNNAHEDAVNAVVVSENGTVYTGSADGLIRVWERSVDRQKFKLVTTLRKHKSSVNALALNGDGDGDGSVLFSGGSDGCIIVWEKKGEEEEEDHVVFMEALCGHSGAVLCLIYVDDLLVSGSGDSTVRIWGRSGKESGGGFCCMAVLEGHEKPVKSLVVIGGRRRSDDGVVSICSGSLDGEIRVWDLLSKQ